MSIALIVLCWPCAAIANPEGGVVVAGSATISSSNKKLDVYQHSNKAVIDWRSFSIGIDEHTQFHQPSSSAMVLNRVVGDLPSHILGKLTANGNVFLVNPNGVFFGNNAQVDVNGLVASTSNISNADFMAGKLNFTQPSLPNATIINNGLITAQDAGLVGLVAPNVINNGVITARLGRVNLASGDTATIDFYGDGLFDVAVSEDVVSQLVANNGLIETEGGIIGLTAAAGREIVDSLISVKGELLAPTVEQRNGKIVIAAAGSNHNDKAGNSTVIIDEARLDVSGRRVGERGGEIDITADRVAMVGKALVNASGDAGVAVLASEYSAALTADKQVKTNAEFLAGNRRGGGSIRIGGDYLGTGDTQRAKQVFIDKDVTILNDGFLNGDGGRTIVWSDESTQFLGNVFSRGGLKSGHGGFLETSGKLNLKAEGYVDLTATDGFDKGSYLLDPANITIYGNVDPNFSSSDGSINLGDEQVFWVDAADIDSYLTTSANSTSFAAFADVNDGDVNRSKNAFFQTNITIGANPEGTIYEQGGSGFGTWIGFDSNGNLHFHAGRGNNFNANDAAHLTINAASAPTGTGDLSWSIDVANNRITAYWNGVEIGSEQASSNFSSWSGGNVGGYGEANSSVVTGANANNFNGVLNTSLTYYEDRLSAPSNSGSNLIPTGLSDKSQSGNSLRLETGNISLNQNHLNGNNTFSLGNGTRLMVNDTNDINLSHQTNLSRSFTFRTDGNVTQRQMIYSEGGGTNGYLAYVENNKLYVGIYNDGAANREWHTFDVDANTTYNLTSTLDASVDNFTSTLNGVEVSSTGLGLNEVFKAHSGDIDFGANGDGMRGPTGGNISESDVVSTLAESVFYNRTLTADEADVLHQYNASKWGVELNPTTGNSSEAAEAMSENGYSSFTTRYLEKLSNAADIILQADNSINLDLQGDTLNLSDDRNISLLTTSGDISTLSNGSIIANQLASGGNISFDAGGAGNININHELNLNANNGGQVTFSAGGSTNIGNSGNLSVTSNNLTIMSDSFSNSGNINGDVVWQSDNFNTGEFSGTAGHITARQNTASNTLGVGSGSDADTIITDSLVAQLEGGFDGLTFGRSDGGALQNHTSSFNKDVTFYTDSDFINAAAVTSNSKLQVKAGGNVVLNNAISTTSNATNALVLSGEGNLINNADSSALSAANSRWLVYSNNPVGNTRNGLLPNVSEFGKTLAQDSPNTIGSGNRLIYGTTTRPTLTYQVDDSSVEYGDSISDLTASYVSGLLAGDTLTNIGQTGELSLTGSYDIGDDAGSYANVLSGSDGTLANVLGYQYNVQSGDLTVTKANLNVTTSNASREYGELNPTFTSTITGFKLGQDKSVIDKAPSYATAATQVSDIGGYTIIASGANDNNYSFTYNNAGKLAITPANLTVTANDVSRVYGDSNPALTGTITGFKLGQNSDVLTLTPSYSTSAVQASGVGNYAIVAGGGAATNYTLTYNNGQLSVNKAVLNVTLDGGNVRREVGQANPLFNLFYDGFKLGQSIADVTTLPIADTLADKTSPVGTYSIRLVGGIDNNYRFLNGSSLGLLEVVKPIPEINNTLPAIPVTVEQVSQSRSSSMATGESYTSNENRDSRSFQNSISPKYDVHASPKVLGGLVEIHPAVAQRFNLSGSVFNFFVVANDD